MTPRDRWFGDPLGYLYGFAPYVSVASQRAQAAGRLAQLRKKGQTVAPVVIEGRKIATTFWGRSWCDNLERYSDFANRLPRGRSYARNGLVIDLQIQAGFIKALVSGTAVYTVQIDVKALEAVRWEAVRRDVSGAIESVIELLQGRLSDHVMARLCADGTGLFPAPKEIGFRCTCPDGAYMCKHIAAVLYGVGARLDESPGLLFTLRRVNEQDLVGSVGTQAAAALVSGRGGGRGGRRIADETALKDVFGIDLATETTATPAYASPRPHPDERTTPRRRKAVRRTAASSPPARKTPASPKAPKPKREPMRRAAGSERSTPAAGGPYRRRPLPAGNGTKKK